MQNLSKQNTQSSWERALAQQLDLAIDSLRRGEPVEPGVPEVESLLGIAASLLERGQRQQRLIGVPAQ